MTLPIVDELVAYMESNPDQFTEYGMRYYLKHTDLSGLLEPDKEYTFFLPTSSSLRYLIPMDAGDPFITSPEFCRKCLSNIIFPGKLNVDNLSSETKITSLGDVLRLSEDVEGRIAKDFVSDKCAVFITNVFLFVDPSDVVEAISKNPSKSCFTCHRSYSAY